jgi:hypothetical protein
LNKYNDILPLDCQASYYFGQGTLAYIDNNKSLVMSDISEGVITIPLSSFSEEELITAKKLLTDSLPNATEEWLIDNKERMGLFRFAEKG